MIKIDVQSDTYRIIRLLDNNATTEALEPTPIKEIHLIGTAHVSEESAKEVSRIIEEVEPDHVAVELDAARYKSLTQGQDWSNLSITKVLKEGKGQFLLASLALSSFQRSMGTTLPGAEMKAAIDAAKERNIPFSFADRDVTITLKRTWRKSSFWNKMKLIATLINSVLSKDTISSEELESLKEKESLDGMMDELSKELPQVKEVLVDERDAYLAHNIYYAPGKRVVAVVGAAHTLGMVDKFYGLEEISEENSQEQLKSFEILPKPSPVGKVLTWAIPLGVLGLIGYGFITAGWETGTEAFLYWVLANAIFGGIGAIAALAHPLTILVTIVAAPITSLNPTIGVGFVSGIVQGWVRKPRVIDFEHIPEDTKSVRGFYKNRFTHALVVFLLTSLGSAIGTFVGIPFIVSLFGAS